jgi:HAD superfamily hydrolase (TIGR01509 family)
VSYEDVRQQIGKGGDHLMPVFLPKEQLEKQGKQIEEYRRNLFLRKYMPQVRRFPRGRELFERLRADGKKIALASSAKGDELDTYKRIARITDLLDTETSADDVKESKPDPDVFEAALQRLKGIQPGDAVAVGDTPYDAEAAGKSGLRMIGVLSGGFPAEQLTAAGCVELYRDVAELLDKYEQSALKR